MTTHPDPSALGSVQNRQFIGLSQNCQMRRRRTSPGIFFLFFLFNLGFPLLSSADRIVLKNGNTIDAEQVWEEGDRVQYQRNRGLYTISKTTVKEIVKSSAPPLEPSIRDRARRAISPLAESATLQQGLPAKKTLDAWVLSILPEVPNTAPDQGNLEQRLGGLEIQFRERPKDEEIRAQWLNVTEGLAHSHVEQGDLAGAARIFERALTLVPDQFPLLLRLGGLSVRLNDYPMAQKILKSAVALNPESAEAHALLGMAEYFLGHNDESITQWETARSLQPSLPVSGWLSKVKRENQVEKDFSSQASAHFEIQSDGKKVSPELTRAIQDELEKDLRELSDAYRVNPPQPIPVILYTGSDFQQATNAPHFVRALNDGKLRIPVQGATTMTVGLARLLKHELVHTFIQVKSSSHAPHWIHEGLAQYESFPGVCESRHPWWKEMESQSWIPLASLDRAIETPASDPEANQAYREALSLVCYLTDVYGSGAVQSLLSELTVNSNIDRASETILHSGWGSIEIDWKNYLDRRSRL